MNKNHMVFWRRLMNFIDSSIGIRYKDLHCKTNGYIMYVYVIQVILISFISSAVLLLVLLLNAGYSKTESYYQKLLIEKYDATYCDGKFSLEKCDD